jgi:hypothetical protein
MEQPLAYLIRIEIYEVIYAIHCVEKSCFNFSKDQIMLISVPDRLCIPL